MPVSLTRLIVLICVLITAGCAERMTTDEARKIAVTLSKDSYVPPPRRIQDVVSILEKEDLSAVRADDRGEIPASPPADAAPDKLYRYYLQRGSQDIEMGREGQALEDFHLALKYADQASIKDVGLLIWLGRLEKIHGNYNRSLAFFDRAYAITKNARFFAELVEACRVMGDVERAKKVHREAMNRHGFQTNPSPITRIFLHRMNATIFECDGKWKEAEGELRQNLEITASNPYPTPGGNHSTRISHRLRLGRLLILQDRFMEAELEMREALMESLQYYGKGSTITWTAIANLVSVLVIQGRTADAEKLARTTLDLVLSAEQKRPSFSFRARMSLAGVLATKGEYQEAVEQVDLTPNRQGIGNMLRSQEWNPARMNVMLALVMGGRAEEALVWVDGTIGSFSGRLGENHPLTAEMISIRGVAEFMMGKKRDALRTLSKSLPMLVESVSGQERNYPAIQRMKVVLETYLALLSEVYGTGTEKELGLDVAAEAFRIADLARSRSVQTALAASSARAAVTDPDLAALIRQVQDAEAKTASLQESLVDMVSAPPGEQLPALIGDLRARLENLTKAKAVLVEEITRRFPKYSAFVSPQPPSIEGIRSSLRETEALLSIYAAQDRIYLWAMKRDGKVAFNVSLMSRKELSEQVKRLRESLDPKPRTLGDIPPFDVALAHELYKKVLKPVESGWRGAKALVVVAGDPLGQIPLSLLVTEPCSISPDEDTLFENYRKVPWLMRMASITHLPSTSSFLNLRNLPGGDRGRKPFAGFGDPIFNPGQMAALGGGKEGPPQSVAARGRPVRVRGIRTTEDTDLDRNKQGSLGLSSLNRLPDTAEEIKGICGSLGADAGRDIFLGKEASESQVKSMDLSNFRVIAFATHALIPGDLDGLDQPALALSSPAVTGGREDGLLTMGEVLKLKLNADWVVLSACNTGAAEGEGAEAVSGLGRSFFYAGTRAILVSLWPVESSSARLLTTGLFRHQQESGMSRSQALRSSIQVLMDEQSLKDGETGGIVASYAHPFFWAPFIMVGESGGAE